VLEFIVRDATGNTSLTLLPLNRARRPQPLRRALQPDGWRRRRAARWVV